MGNFCNNGLKIVKLIVKSWYISYININLEKICWFENWIFKNFFLNIYRSQTDYKEKKLWRSRNSNDKHYNEFNGQTQKVKKINNNIQNTTQKNKHWAIHTILITGCTRVFRKGKQIARKMTGYI